MGFERPNTEQAPQTQEHYRTHLVFAKAAIAAAILAGLIAGGAFYTSGTSRFAASSGDDVSDADKTARIEAFNSLKFLSVSKVAEKDIPGAIDTMHLAPADKAKMQTEVGHASGLPTPAAAPARSPAPDPAGGKVGGAAISAVATKAATGALPLPAVSHAGNGSPVTLAWVRLWDTDVEDGDVVRIDSSGYSRTVSLTNQGITFAIPVPASGQVRITGVRDGDGGGITVGLASGSAQAVLPIMSVGQVLTLNVRTN
jgi:hypothetical protein